MKISVVYSSITGNTKKIAEAVATALGTSAVALESKPDIKDCEIVAVGFWVDKGLPNAAVIDFLKELNGKKVFLFGTLGAMPDSPHADKCRERAGALVSEKNDLRGVFLCQGGIAPQLIEMFRKLPPDNVHAITPEKEKKYEEAAKHPDERDCAAAAQAALNVL